MFCISLSEVINPGWKFDKKRHPSDLSEFDRHKFHKFHKLNMSTSELYIKLRAFSVNLMQTAKNHLKWWFVNECSTISENCRTRAYVLTPTNQRTKRGNVKLFEIRHNYSHLIALCNVITLAKFSSNSLYERCSFSLCLLRWLFAGGIYLNLKGKRIQTLYKSHWIESTISSFRSLAHFGENR